MADRSPNPSRSLPLRLALFSVLLIAVLILPFAVFGEQPAAWLMEVASRHKAGVFLVAVLLLSADCVAPVPSSVVIAAVASLLGPLAGVVAGTAGLMAGVITSAWFGRATAGRVLPRFLGDSEQARLRTGLERNLPFTLACWRSVPVMAEASVMLAAATGIPTARIVRATVLPNLIIALVYSLAAAESIAATAAAVVLTVAFSLLAWGLKRRELDSLH